MRITPENLIENLPKIGGWSVYALASEALQHYFPEEYNSYGYCDPVRECALLAKLGCNCWQDVVIKYHKEIGYKGEFNPDAINEF